MEIKWTRWDWLAVGFLFLLTAGFYAPLWSPWPAHRQAFTGGDFYYQFYAFARYEHQRLWQGELPLWNPYTFAGHPFLADIQSAVFYPLSLLTLLLSGPGEFSPGWLQAEAAVHIALAAVFAYLLVRRWTANRVAGLVSAITFAFSGYLTGYPPLQLAILETQIWLPLLLLLLDIGLTEMRWPAILAAGLVWGIALLAGHPQSAMYLFYVALLYAVYRTVRHRVPWRRALFMHGLWIAIGIGLAAIALLPAWAFMRLSVRAASSYEALSGGFAWQDLVQIVFPGRYTLWSPVYVGLLPLGLVLVSIVTLFVRDHGHRRSDLLFWLLLAILGLVLSLGGKTPLYRLFYHIVPGFNLFRSQERAIYVTCFAFAVLAGEGWFWLSERLRVWWANKHRLVLFVGAVAVLVIVLDLWAVNARTNFVPGSAGSQLYDSTWAAKMVADPDIFRIENSFGLPGNIGCLTGVQDWGGASPLRSMSHKMVTDALPRWRIWQLFDVRYVATWEHDLPGPFEARQIAMQGQEWAKDTVYLHRIETDFPRAWIVHQAVHVDDLQALSTLAGPDFDPYAQVLLAEPVDISSDPSPVLGDSPSSTVQILAYQPERIELDTVSAAPAWLVLSEWHFPGWQVTIDGQSQTMLRADYALRAVALPAGQHKVIFRYRPLSVYVGGSISILICLATLSSMVYIVRRAQ